VTQVADDDGTPLRRDRNGDLVPDGDAQDAHDARCRDGWLNDWAHADTVIPCPRCRPHLYRRNRR